MLLGILAVALVVCAVACGGFYYAYVNNVSKMIDASFYIFFAVLCGLLVIAIIIAAIMRAVGKKNLAKKMLREAERQEQIKQRDAREEQLKLEKTAKGEFYLTTRERGKIKALSEVDYDTACETKNCPVCGQPLYRLEGTDNSPYYVDNCFDGNYDVWSDGRITKHYEGVTKTVKRPSIYLSCFKCDYGINYINGYEVKTTTINEFNSHTGNVPKTIREIKWGEKLAPIMRDTED